MKTDNQFSTEQERFWAGAFGDSYIARNQSAEFAAANTALFTKILAHTTDVKSVIELGANVGMNLNAIRRLLPFAQLAAVEINQNAIAQLRSIEELTVYPESVLGFTPAHKYDLSFTKGVLIHIAPDHLPQAYDALWRSSARYICVTEYYSPSPVEIDYRGNSDKLFKRDFAGEILDRFSSLKLIDYGFVYHRDANFPQDDLNWFLMEKTRD